MDLGGFGAPIIKPRRKNEPQIIKEQDKLFENNDENDMNLDKMYGKEYQEDEKKEDNTQQEEVESYKDHAKDLKRQNNEIEENLTFRSIDEDKDRTFNNVDVYRHEKQTVDKYGDLDEDENIQTPYKNTKMHNETDIKKVQQEKKDEIEQSSMIRTSFDNYYGTSYKNSEIEPVKPTETKYNVKGQIDELLTDKKKKTSQKTSEKKINNAQERTNSKTHILQEKRITNKDEQTNHSDEKELHKTQKIVNSTQSNKKDEKLIFEKPNIFDTKTIRSSLNRHGTQKQDSDKKTRMPPLDMKNEISEMKKNDVEQEQIPEKNIIVKIDNKPNRKENLISGFLEMLKKPNENTHTAKESKKIEMSTEIKKDYAFSKDYSGENNQIATNEDEQNKTQTESVMNYTPKSPIYSTIDTEMQVQRMIRKDNSPPKENLNEKNASEQKLVENSEQTEQPKKQFSEYENEKQKGVSKNREIQDEQIMFKKIRSSASKKPKNEKVINDKQTLTKSKRAHRIHNKKAMKKTKEIEIGNWKFKPEEIKPVAKTNKTKKEDEHLQIISQHKNKQEHEIELNEIKNPDTRDNNSNSYKENYANTKLGYRLGLIKSDDNTQVKVDQAQSENKDKQKLNSDIVDSTTKTQNYTQPPNYAQTPSIPQIGPQKIETPQNNPIDELENVAQDMINNKKANLQKQTTDGNALNKKTYQDNKTQELIEQKNISEKPRLESQEKTELIQKPVAKPGLFSSLASRLGINKNKQTQNSDLTSKQSNQLNSQELKPSNVANDKNVESKNIASKKDLNVVATQDVNEKNNQEQKLKYNINTSKNQQEQTDKDTSNEKRVDEADAPIRMAQDQIKEQTRKTEETKEDKDITDELLIAYSKENCRWLYQIYAMGGMSITDFRSRVISKMHGTDEKDEETSSDKEQITQTKATVTDKKFKK
jgi:hypothetical protein